MPPSNWNEQTLARLKRHLVKVHILEKWKFFIIWRFSVNIAIKTALIIDGEVGLSGRAGCVCSNKSVPSEHLPGHDARAKSHPRGQAINAYFDPYRCDLVFTSVIRFVYEGFHFRPREKPVIASEVELISASRLQHKVNYSLKRIRLDLRARNTSQIGSLRLPPGLRQLPSRSVRVAKMESLL